MRQRKAARQPCGGRAVTEPDAKPSIRQGSRVENTTSIKSSSRRSAQPIASDAELIVNAAMWLERVREWMKTQLDLATTAEGTRSDVITLLRADLEAFRGGLAQAVGLLDRLTVDPTQLPPADPSPAPEVSAATTTATGRTVH